MTPQFKSTHGLDFEMAPSPYSDSHQMFRVGTCTGQWTFTEDSYVIISVLNSAPGNGHLGDVFEWFENSCRRDSMNLLVVACLNSEFYAHLLEKRGFRALDKKRENCIKIFNRPAYRRLLKRGNAVIRKGTLSCV